MSAPTMEPRIVQSSELSRHPAGVFAAAEDGPVLVTRRDGEALILTTQSRAQAQQEMLGVAAQLVAASLEDGPLVARLAKHFPWMGVLSADDKQSCAAEIIETARASFDLGQPARLLTVIAAWRNTAEAIAAGWASVDVTWLDEPVDVPDPRG